MSTSSADPQRLTTYLAASADMAEQARARVSALAAEYDAVVPRLQWGTFDASATLGDLATWMRLNDADDQWLTVIGNAFAAADARGPTAVPDETLAAALRSAGVATGPRTDLTVDDPVMAAAPGTSGFADDPVCTATGHLVEIEHDLRLPWRAGPLGWVRTYTSRWRRPGPFGRGWASWASCALTIVDDGQELLFPDGRRAVYTPQAAGGYGRVAGVSADLEATASGHRLRWANGDTWNFDRAGALTAVTTATDAVAFIRDDEARLVRLEHDHGRWVRLDWRQIGHRSPGDHDDAPAAKADTGHDRVVRLTSSDGRVVTYDYDTQGDLVRAVQPGGVVRTYQQAGDGLIGACFDADGVREFANTYDEQGRVLTQVSPFGRTTRFRYVAPGVTVVDDEVGGPTATYLHDPTGRLVAVVDDHDAQLHRSFDEWGNLTGVTDRTGAITTRLHDPDGRLLAETDALGATWAWTYDGTGRVVSTTDPLGATVQLTYTGADRQPSTITDALGAATHCRITDGEITAITDPDGVVTALDRDADGLVTTITDALGGATRLHRDPTGAVIAVIDAEGGTTTVDTDDAGRVITRHLPTGGGVALTWSSAGRLVAATNPVGGTSTIAYESHGRPATLVDPTGSRIDVHHDERGHVDRVARPDQAGGHATVLHAHDGVGRLTSFTDPTGAVWTRDHDAEGRLTLLTDPAGRQQRRRYDAVGRLVEVDDGAGVVTRYGHDLVGRVASVTDGTGATTTCRHDAVGRQVASVDPAGGVTRWTWSPGGRLLCVTSPEGRTTQLEHDRAGRPSSMTTPDGERVRLQRDGAGRVVARTDADGEVALDLDAAGRVVAVRGVRGVASIDRDECGRVVAQTDATGATVRAAFDVLGRLTAVTDPLGDTVRHTYDPMGLLASSTGPDAATTTYTHDEVGRVTSWTDPLGATTQTRRDASGRPSAVVDPTGTLSYQRDEAGRVVGWTDRAGVVTRVGLDEAGRMVSAAAVGRTVQFDRDARGQVVRSDHGDGRALRHSYGGDGLRLSMTRPDGSVTTWARDEAGRITAVSDAAAGVTRMLYRQGRLAQVEAPAGTTRYDWSNDGLLDGVVREGIATRLSHDPAGRVVAVERADGTTRYTYDSAGQLVDVAAANGAGYSFSYRHGRRIRMTAATGTSQYSYDLGGRLTRVDGSNGATVLRYDAAGRRISENGPGGRTHYRWDGQGRLTGISRTGLDGIARDTRLTVGPLGDLDAVDGVPLTWDGLDGASTLLEVNGTAVSPPDGAPRTRRSEDPFVPAASPPGSAVRTTSDGDVLIDDRLIWLRARTYDPETGLFLSPDPLPSPTAHPTGSNPWAYAANDPVGLSDPLGLTPMTDADLAAYRADASEGIGSHLLHGAGAFIEDPVHWVAHHGDALGAAGAIALGGALVATGVGAPFGAGLLIGAGMSMAGQVTLTGQIDARQVWISAAAGGFSGGVGSAIGSATANAGITGLRSIGIQALAGAGTDATTSSAAQYISTGHVDPARLALDCVVGGISGGVAGGATTTTMSTPRVPELVTVYRGTSTTNELSIHADTGLLMSEAARIGYMQNHRSMSAAWHSSQAAHVAALREWGSEAVYAQAHAAFGLELSELGRRSLISVTSDPEVAKHFAGEYGRVFSAVVSSADLIPQTLPGAGESELLVRHWMEAQG